MNTLSETPLTKKEKLDALMKSIPRISFYEACNLLGFDENDPELRDHDKVFDALKNMFGW